jgi:glycosyltransferase involved in cell wall biosynthesis
MDQRKISCLIPAFNEGKRISKVLRAACHHPLIDEIIVIDDASTDDTARIVSRFSDVRLIRNKKNLGKSGAILKGITAAKNDYLLFLDADLIGLKPVHLTRLIEPVIGGEADVTISLRKNSSVPFRELGLDFISGERVFHRDLIPDPCKLRNIPSFGLEVYINKFIIKKKLRIRVVRWDDVISPYPDKKFGLVEGTRRFLRMVDNIESLIGISGIARQIIEMKRLSEPDAPARQEANPAHPSRKNKQKLLFLYLKTGGGHISCARSVADYLCQNHGAKTEIVMSDALENTMRFRKFIIEDTYRISQNYAKWGFELTYKMAENQALWLQLRKIITLMVESNLREKLLEENPDKIVIFHSFLIKPVENILEEYSLDIPVLTVVTDPFSPPPQWFGSRRMQYILFSKAALAIALRKKIARSKCRLIDNYILNPKFGKRLSPGKIRALKSRFGFKQNKKLILIIGGGDGIPHGISILRALLKKRPDAEIAIVWGRNESLKKLSERLFRRHKNLHIYGFVDFVYELVSLSDIVITKAGPAMVLEILLQGKLPIITSYLSQERGNVDFVVRNNLGFHEPKVSRLPALVRLILGDGKTYQGFHKRLQKLKLRNGTPEVGEYILKFPRK